MESLMPIFISLMLLACYSVHSIILSFKYYKDKINILRLHQTERVRAEDATILVDGVDGMQELKKKYDEDAELNKSRYLNLFLLVTYLTLPSVTTKLFGAFNCIDTDPDKVQSKGVSTRFLRNDVTIACDSPRYVLSISYAIVLIMVYPIGVPLMYYYFLSRNKEEIKKIGEAVKADSEAEEDKAKLEGHHAHGAFGGKKLDTVLEELKATVKSSSKPLGLTYRELEFLYKAYEGRCWYWEVVETIRKLLLTAVLSVCGEGSGFQIVIGILIAITFVKLYAFYSPYVDDEDDNLQELAQYQIFFTLFGALIIRASIFSGDWATQSLESSLILVNISSTFFTIHSILYENASMYAKFIDEIPNRIIEIFFTMFFINKKNDHVRHQHHEKSVDGVYEKPGKGIVFDSFFLDYISEDDEVGNSSSLHNGNGDKNENNGDDHRVFTDKSDPSIEQVDNKGKSRVKVTNFNANAKTTNGNGDDILTSETVFSSSPSASNYQAVILENKLLRSHNNQLLQEIEILRKKISMDYLHLK